MDFKNGVKNIQAAGYNGARTVDEKISKRIIGKFYKISYFQDRNYGSRGQKIKTYVVPGLCRVCMSVSAQVPG